MSEAPPFMVYSLVFLDFAFPFVAPSALTFDSTRIVEKKRGIVGCMAPISGNAGNTSKDPKIESLVKFGEMSITT